MVSHGPRRPRQAGLTMVELMVTMVIAGLVAASTYAFFAGQRRVYETQMKVLNMQQNLWASIDVMSRYIRMSGAGMLGCVLPDPDGAAVGLGDPPPIGPNPPQTGLRVFRSVGAPALGTADYGAAGNAFFVAPLWVRNAATANGTDELTIAFGNGAFAKFIDTTLTANVGQATDTVQIAAGLDNGYRVGELFLLIDADGTVPTTIQRGCTLLSITGIVPGSGVLEHDSAASWWNPPGNPGGIPFIRPTGYTTASRAGVRTFGQLFWLRFWIRFLPARPPALMMTQFSGAQVSQATQVLAEGIEDMQISYACDVTDPTGLGAPDGILSEGAPGLTSDEWVNNVAGDSNPLIDTVNRWYRCNSPEAIRLTLIARTTEREFDVGVTDPDTLIYRRPAAEDNPQGPLDPFRHRVATTTIFPRNRNR